MLDWTTRYIYPRELEDWKSVNWPVFSFMLPIRFGGLLWTPSCVILLALRGSRAHENHFTIARHRRRLVGVHRPDHDEEQGARGARPTTAVRRH